MCRRPSHAKSEQQQPDLSHSNSHVENGAMGYKSERPETRDERPETRERTAEGSRHDFWNRDVSHLDQYAEMLLSTVACHLLEKVRQMSDYTQADLTSANRKASHAGLKPTEAVSARVRALSQYTRHKHSLRRMTCFTFKKTRAPCDASASRTYPGRFLYLKVSC